jgi:hypothetical protein
MKRLTTIVFAALVAVTLSMPVWAQTPAPAKPAATQNKEEKKDAKSKKKDKKEKKADKDSKKTTK